MTCILRLTTVTQRELCYLYREYVYSVDVYEKCLTRLGELIIFEPWQRYRLILFIFQSSTLLSFIISNTDNYDNIAVYRNALAVVMTS